MHALKSFSSHRTGIILAVILVLAFGISLGTAFTHIRAAYAADQKLATPAVTTSGRAALRDLQDAFTSIADEVLPSVVSITSKRVIQTQGRGAPQDDPFQFFPFEMPRPNAPQKRQELSYGSGVIIRANGYILTNDHVVGGADKVTVKLKDGREFEGKVFRDQRSDLAIVKIDAAGLPAAKLGDSSKVKPGMWAIAMGSPFELEQTVTVGFISATGREEVASDGSEARFYPNLLQTDASINPGNSGGPLVNADGEVIGINALIRSGGSPMLGGGGNIGIGFAIPINTAKFVLDQLITHGKVTRGYLGLTPEDVTPQMADRYGVKEGAFVRTVEVGSPADKASIQVEDVITEFDGKKVANEIQRRDIIAATAPGKQVSVALVRNKVQKTVTVTVGESPSLEASSGEVENNAADKLGFTVASITPELADKYKLDAGMKGVVVTGVTSGSPADMEGVEAGLVIASVNGTPVNSVSEFNAATKDVKSGDTVRLSAQTSKTRALIEFTLD